ncbi:hypothetical protein JT359_12745 [Candidatus Poribacteria bacterium]|nr:hypothetical protein [Candidatus Poribacteria bacterium]
MTTIYSRNEKKKAYRIQLACGGFGIGYIIGYYFIEGIPTFPPLESIHWIFYFTILAMFSSTYWHLSGWRPVISKILYAILIPRLFLDSYFLHNWGQIEGFLWWGCLAIGIFLLCNSIQYSYSVVGSGNTRSFIFFNLSWMTAVIYLISGSLRLFQHTMVLVPLFATTWILGYIAMRGSKSNSKTDEDILPVNIAPVASILLISMWLIGGFYTEAPFVSMVLLAFSPLLFQLGRIPSIQKMSTKKVELIQLGLTTLCFCIAIIVAVLQSGLFGENPY